jgi:hypothetical protein
VYGTSRSVQNDCHYEFPMAANAAQPSASAAAVSVIFHA